MLVYNFYWFKVVDVRPELNCRQKAEHISFDKYAYCHTLQIVRGRNISLKAKESFIYLYMAYLTTP